MSKQNSSLPQAYVLFAQTFNYPDKRLWSAEENILSFLKNNGILDNRIMVSQSGPDSFLEKMGEEYIAYFDIGIGGKPSCPLYEGLYRKDEDRQGIIMELIRFYNFFDLKLSQSNRDYPDHLSTELEFMSYLASGEDKAVASEDAMPFQRAQKDFLNRHLAIWLPQLQSQIDKHLSASVYGQICFALVNLVKSEQERLINLLDGGNNGNEKNIS